MWNAARRWRRAVASRCRTVFVFSSLRGPGPSSAPSGSCQEKGLGASKVVTAHATCSRARHAQRQTRAARRQPHAPAAWKMAACAASPWWRADSTGPRLATLSFHSHGLSVQFNGFCMLTNHSRWGVYTVYVSKKLEDKKCSAGTAKRRACASSASMSRMKAAQHVGAAGQRREQCGGKNDTRAHQAR